MEDEDGIYMICQAASSSMCLWYCVLIGCRAGS